jgi:hypothetical protein
MSGSRALGVLGGTGCADDGGVDDRAAGHLQPLRLQVAMHLLEEAAAHLVLLMGPRHHLLHLGQKRRAPRNFAEALESARSQCHLFHRDPSGERARVSDAMPTESLTCSDFP